MKITLTSVLLALSVCAYTDNASATNVTYTGMVTYDNEYNAWGAQSATNSFTGDPVTITFNENLANGYRPFGYVSPSAFWAGGANDVYNGPSPIIIGTIFVAGGPSLSVPGTWLGEELNSGAFELGGQTGGEQFSYSEQDSDNIIAWVSADLAGTNVPQFGSYSGPNFYNNAFQAYFQTYNASSYGFIEGSLTGVSSGVTASDIPSGVPETSSWAMMLVGFAGLGLVGCRRARMKSKSTT